MNLTLVVLCEQKEMKQLDVGVVQEEKMELELKLEEEKKFRQEQESKITRLTELICVSSRSTGQTPKVENKVRTRVKSTSSPSHLCQQQEYRADAKSGEQGKETGEKHVFLKSFVSAGVQGRRQKWRIR